MALGHQKAKHTTRSDSPFETFANLHPALLPTDIMPTRKGSKPCLKPSLLSPWLTKPQTTVAEQSELLKTSIGGGRRNRVHLPRFYVFHTCSNFAVKLLFCKSNQVVHLSAKILIKLLSTTRLQWNTKHMQLQEIERQPFATLMRLLWSAGYTIHQACLSCFQQDQVCLFHLCVTTPSSSHAPNSITTP